ncbi:MAG TPA: alpha/beta fold hydrolase [Candidatus Binataceae bacterium]|nr:alpha/beta fold hydrolase [Candidatus Binataceae bacterium]
MPLASINGIQLYYEVHGEGPAVVFAHGGGGSHLSWWQQMPTLSQHFRCVTFDHRGFGASRDVTGGPGAEAFIEDLRQLLDHLGITRTALVSQSMGGWTSLGFASKYPDRVSALALCDTTAGIDDAEVANAMKSLRDASQNRLSIILQRAYSADFPKREPAKCFLYQQISGLNVNVPSDLLTKLMAMRHSVDQIIGKRIPTLLLVGEEDALTPATTMELMARRIPHARFVKVPGAGHSVYFERPDEFSRIVLDFLRGAAA